MMKNDDDRDSNHHCCYYWYQQEVSMKMRLMKNNNQLLMKEYDHLNRDNLDHHVRIHRFDHHRHRLLKQQVRQNWIEQANRHPLLMMPIDTLSIENHSLVRKVFLKNTVDHFLMETYKYYLMMMNDKLFDDIDVVDDDDDDGEEEEVEVEEEVDNTVHVHDLVLVVVEEF